MSSGGGPSGRDGEFFALAEALRAFRAELGDGPSDRALARVAGVSPTTVGAWLRGERFPQEIGKVLAVVGMMRTAAAARGIAVPASGPAGLLDEKCWRRAHQAEARHRADAISSAVQGAQAARVLVPPSAGWPLAEVTDPFALEVHRPVQPEEAPAGLSALPLYVPRDHDQALAQVVRAAAGRRSGVAVLVGGSSTGKTRACWETLGLLRDQQPPWRLWHPIDPSRPDAVLRELPGVGPRTVVWLNEAQFYLDVTEGGLGERVAAGLRELLRDPVRAPVLVLATLWPQYWDELTARPPGGPDPYAQARELLSGHDITVPTAFTPAQLGQLTRSADARLALAAAGAQDGQVVQFLAGAPELLARYRNASPAAAALIRAAMDARRLGMGIGLPQGFLAAAAPGYLTDTEWDILSENWENMLQEAWAHATVPCKGVRGPLARIPPARPAMTHPARPGFPDADDQSPGEQAGISGGGPLYRLADYLDQYGRAYRKDQIPPAGFWAAAADRAALADQIALGHAAHDRGLYRAAAQLLKNAAASGSPHAAIYLTHLPPCLRSDARPASWATAHVSLENPNDVALMLEALRVTGAQDPAVALLDRDPAGCVRLDDPSGLAFLLRNLRKAGAYEQAAALLDRDPAACVRLDDPVGVARLLGALQEAGAQDQAVALLDRDPAGCVRLDDLSGLAFLLGNLRKAGARGQVTALAGRAAARVRLDDPHGVAGLLDALQEAGARGQVTALAGRAAARVRLDDPSGVARLLGALQEAGAQEQAAALLDRDLAACVRLDHPSGVAALLEALQEAGAREQVAVLLDRDPAAHVSLDNPNDVNDAVVLGIVLRAAGAQDQAAALASRAVPLDNPAAVAELLRLLRRAGLQDEAAVLLDRDPAAHISLDDPRGVARLLGELRKAGAQDEVAVLLDRDPAAHISLDDPHGVARLLGAPVGVPELLGELRAAGAQAQVTALTDRLPGAGMFELFLEQQGSVDQFRFGQEADGSASGPWGWDDLD